MAAAAPSRPELQKSPGRVIHHDVTRLELAECPATKSVGTQTEGPLEECDEGYEGDLDDRRKNWSMNLFDECRSHESSDSFFE